MKICNVMHILTVNGNTAIVVDGSRELYGIGMGVLDEHGNPYEVISVGTESIVPERTALLLPGSFNSSKIFFEKTGL